MPSDQWINEAARVHHATRWRGSGGAVAARAQQPEPMRHIGVLTNLAAAMPSA
jgi:hypothetical protein